MNLFKLRDQGPYCKDYPWAYGYGPLDKTPFLSAAARERILKFWQVDGSKSGLEIGEGGSKWPDFLGCGAPPPSFFISERVAKSMAALKCEITHLTEIPVGTVKSKKLKLTTPPRYFVPQVAGGIRIDWDAMDIKLDSEGYPIYNHQKALELIADSKTWNGFDLFSWANFQHEVGLTLLCTQKVVDLAEKEKWTNVRFDPVATT